MAGLNEMLNGMSDRDYYRLCMIKEIQTDCRNCIPTLAKLQDYIGSEPLNKVRKLKDKTAGELKAILNSYNMPQDILDNPMLSFALDIESEGRCEL